VLKQSCTAEQSINSRINRNCTLGIRTLTQALDWFGSIAALVIEVQKLLPPIVLIPVPRSGCLVTSPKYPSIATLVQAIASRLKQKVVVCDALRWKKPQTPSHLGGSRDPQQLLRNLDLIRIPPRGTVVIVDDVLTTGAHLLASAVKLSSAGVLCTNAICVAKAERTGHSGRFSLNQTIVATADLSASILMQGVKEIRTGITARVSIGV
jgi:hypothetical protein